MIREIEHTPTANVISAGNVKAGLIVLSVTILLTLIGVGGGVVLWLAYR